MKRFLTTIVFATVLAGLPVFASAFNATGLTPGLTSAASPAPDEPGKGYRRRHRYGRYGKRHGYGKKEGTEKPKPTYDKKPPKK